MRHRILVATLPVVAFLGGGSLLARGAGACAMDKICCVESHSCCESGTSSCCPSTEKKWSVANFVDAVMVKRTLVSGTVLVVHDDAKMARGEPCTTFYRFDKVKGQQEALVSFHCKPRRAEAVGTATFATVPTDVGIKRLVEYQLAGETEAHGVPR